jgi:NADPH:quinone reductase-like Zn-dependent oxidoreductase
VARPTDRLRHQAEIVEKTMAFPGSGELQLHIDSTFSLTEAAAAHRRLDAGVSGTAFEGLRIAGYSEYGPAAYVELRRYVS